MYPIETKDLSYRFPGAAPVLDRLSLQVPEGAIYGFLGPNGAGKTTTIRLLLGLLRRQQGEVYLLGRSLEQQRLQLLRQVGSLIESPSVYAQLTAWENLEVWRRIYRCPKERIATVLDWVGLSSTGHKKAGQFSLGMKQRLGIAIALLHRPSLLILDEPTNGLDPNGIIEIRELLQQLNREQGMTILVSSHLLTEIGKVASHAGVINNGKLIFQGTIDQLQLQAKRRGTAFVTDNPMKTAELMMQEGFTPAMEGQVVILPAVGPEHVALLTRVLSANDISIYQVNNSESDLESIFMNLIKN